MVAISRFSDEEEAITLANGTDYSLAAAVWTKDISRAHTIARKLKAGTVWINTYGAIDPMSPFGGYKQSGFGRELGPQGLGEFQQLKHIHIGEPTDVAEKPYFSLIFDD